MSKNEILHFFGPTTWITGVEAEFIYDEIIKLPNEGRFLELGTGAANSTRLFSQAKPNWTVYTVDAYGGSGTPPLMYSKDELRIDGNGIVEVANKIKDWELTNVIQIVSGFDTLHWELEVDGMFIDGSHWYDDVKKDWDKFSPFLKPHGLIVFHDYDNVYGVQDFIQAEVVPSGKWEFWNKQTIGFAKRV